jgi:hypothetical protein
VLLLVTNTLSAGNTSLANTNITGFINASSTANVGGAATLRSTLNVTGATTLNNTLAVGNTSVTGFITATTNSTFSGDTTTIKGIRFSTDSSYTVGNTSHRPLKIWSDDIETENITITGFITGTIAPAGSIIPTTNLSADLGSSAKWFDELFVGSITTNTFTVSDGGDGVSITSNTQSFKSNSSITAISIRANTTSSNTTLSGNLVTITSNTNVSVANLTVTNGTFISTNGSVTTTVNNSTIQIGGGATVNSTIFTGASNNSTYLNGQLASYYTNATNLSTGTVASARIAGSYTGITGVGTISTGTWQGSQISTTYTQAKITSISGGNGLTGTVTTSGSISVLANTGIVANGTGTYVNAAYIATINANNATYFNGQAASYYTGYSDTKAAAAYSNAVSYAGTIAGTAYSNAISYAGTIAGTAYSNAVSYAGTIAGTAYSNATTFSANASNLGNGTVPSGRIAGSYTGITGVGIISTGTWQGSQISTTYTQAKVTSVSGGNGLTGTVTTSGSISVRANTGIVANTTGLYVNSSYIGTLSSNNATYFNGQAASYYTGYSATIAGTAYSNATSYAATIAGTAYTNAVSTAASDATSKAGTAYSNATSYAATIAGTAYSNSTSYTTTYAPSKTGTGASGTWGISITGNAGSVDGYSAAEAATGSTVAARTSDGYLYATYFNTNHAASGATGDTVFYSSTDDFIRKNNSTGMRASLNVPTRSGGDASGTWGISITGNAATATKWATARTLSLTGAVTGSASVDGSGSISLATTATSDPTLTLSGDASGSATFTNLGSATLSVTVANDSHTHDGRYYTETESNTLYMKRTANDTVTANTLWQDSKQIQLGTGGDLQIYHDGTNAVLNNDTGSFLFYEVTGGSYIWHVAGANKLELDSSGNLTAASNITAYSDVRLKKEIKTIDNALNKVTSLRGVNFIKDEEYQMGVIAQEVEEIIPEVVLTNNEGIKSVAYGNMVGLLIEAIKELKAEIEELKGKN